MAKHVLNTATPGELWALSLGGEEYGYVRILRGACLALIPLISHGVTNNSDAIVAFPAKWHFGYAAPPTDETVIVFLGATAFPDEESAWAPPRYLPPNAFKDFHCITEKGVLRRAEEHEIKGLQRAQSLSPEELRKFILDHRKECTLMEGLPCIPSSVIRNDKMASEPILLEVVFRNGAFPFKGRDVVEDWLADALEKEKVGEITGAGSGPETCAIEVEVRDLARGLDIIRKTLVSLGSPASTEIHQHQPQHIIHQL